VTEANSFGNCDWSVYAVYVCVRFFCYNSMQNTCMRLVQSTSHDVDKYAQLISQQCIALKSTQLFCSNDFCLNFLFWFWGITKQIVTGMSVIIENFWPSVCKMFLSIFSLRQHFTNIRVKNFQWWSRRQPLFL